MTDDPHHQYLSDVFGNTVAYVDPRRGSEDVYTSFLEFIPEEPMLCDIDADADVYREDINLILSFRNEPAQGPEDPMDVDGDDVITVLDARTCVLQCTRPRCAVS